MSVHVKTVGYGYLKPISLPLEESKQHLFGLDSHLELHHTTA